LPWERKDGSNSEEKEEQRREERENETQRQRNGVTAGKGFLSLPKTKGGCCVAPFLSCKMTKMIYTYTHPPFSFMWATGPWLDYSRTVFCTSIY